MLLARFLTVGVLNTLIGYGIIFFLMLIVGLSPILSNFLGYAAGLLLSYVLHRDFTFRVNQGRSFAFMRFTLVIMIAYLSNLGVLTALISLFDVHPVASQIVSGAVYVLVSFLLNKYCVFDGTNA